MRKKHGEKASNSALLLRRRNQRIRLLGTELGGSRAEAQVSVYQNHLSGSLNTDCCPILGISDSVGLRWAPKCAFYTVSQLMWMMLISHFENHWFREFHIVLVAGGRRQGVVRDTEGRSLRSRGSIVEVVGAIGRFYRGQRWAPVCLLERSLWVRCGGCVSDGARMRARKPNT